MNLGETFINRNQASPPHLWVVCSPPQGDGAVLIFNFTSVDKADDATCVIHAGEHPFVTHDTAIEYERGRLLTPYAVQVLQARSEMEMSAPVSAELLYRIQSGALASSYTARKFKAIIRACVVTP